MSKRIPISIGEFAYSYKTIYEFAKPGDTIVLINRRDKVIYAALTVEELPDKHCESFEYCYRKVKK